ncbi:hypothetical protein PHYSODRAFT_526333, partial [Phytophthora sojae]
GKQKLATMIDDAEGVSGATLLTRKLTEEMWLSQGQTARGVFKRLKLDQAGTKLFRNRELTTWVSYVTKLDPNNANEMMFLVLKPLYTKKELVMMLTAAKKVDETKAFATNLEKLLLQSRGK